MRKTTTPNRPTTNHTPKWFDSAQETLGVLLLVLGATLFVSSLHGRVFAQDETTFTLVGGQRFDTAQKTFVANDAIRIQEGKIVSLAKLEEGASRIVQLADDDYILPGLVDCHAHYNVRLIKRRREEFEIMPVIYLANGVTTTFSCGEFDPDRMRDLRLAIESGEQLGPHLINSGPYFGRARPGWKTGKTADEIRKEVDYWAEQGVGGFKAKAIAPDELGPLVEQAHTHGLTVTGHLGSGYRNSVNPRDAIALGIDRIEHFVGGDAMPASKSAYRSLPNITREQAEYIKAVELFIDTGTVFDATLTAYGYFGSPREEYEYWIDESKFFTTHMQEVAKERGPTDAGEQFERIYEAKLATIGTFFKMGGTLSLGTDHVSDGYHLPGFGAHRELDAFVRGGIPPADALVIGTLNGAKALGLEESRGSIEVGKNADLLIVKGSPIENIRNTRSVHTVIHAGKLHRTNELLDSVRGKLGPSSEEEEINW